MHDISLLLVEDDKPLANLLQGYLKEAGYEVTLCRRGKDALERLQTEHFDLVLTDIVLPQLSGLSILEQACGDPASTLVIVMTGYSGLEDALHAVRKGAYDFVSKPFQLPELCVRLDNAARYQTLLRRWQAGNVGVAPDGLAATKDAVRRGLSGRPDHTQ